MESEIGFALVMFVFGLLAVGKGLYKLILAIHPNKESEELGALQILHGKTMGTIGFLLSNFLFPFSFGIAFIFGGVALAS